MRRPLLGLCCLVALLAGCGGGSSGGGPSTGGSRTPDASSLPLLRADLRIGVVYSSPDASAKAALDTAFAAALAAGADGYQLSIAWRDLEPRPGVVDVATLATLLDIVQASHLQPYLVIKTIDTVRLALPGDLVSPSDPAALADGVAFDGAAVRARFAAVLDRVVPLLVAHGGFALSVANEVEPWLAARPAQRRAFLDFLAAARAHAHALEPRLAVGATSAQGAAGASLPADVLARSDAAFVTYYPLAGDGSVRDPAVVAADLAAIVAAAGAKPVLLQEVGYPSGYASPGDGSSAARQKAFVDAVFAALVAHPTIRFCSFMQLADWTPAEVAGFVAYYGDADPRFVEYLATLGLIASDGTRKPAFQALLDGLIGRRPPPSGG